MNALYIRCATVHACEWMSAKINMGSNIRNDIVIFESLRTRKWNILEEAHTFFSCRLIGSNLISSQQTLNKKILLHKAKKY